MATRELKAVFKADNRAFLRGVKGVKQGLKDIARFAAIGATIAIGGGLAAVRESLAFGKAMARANTIAKLGKKEFADLTQGIKDLSRETGVSTTELTDGLYQALSAGIPAGNILEYMRATSRAAIGGVVDLATQIEASNRVLEAYGDQLNGVADANDVLAQIVDRGVINHAELGGQIGRVASKAAAANISIEALGAAYIVLTKQTTAALATTQITSLSTQLFKSGENAEMSAALMAKFGTTSATQAIKANGLVTVLLALSDAAGNDVDKLQKMFRETEAVAAVIGLTGKNAKLFEAGLKAMNERLGASENQFKTMAETGSFKTTRMFAVLKIAVIDLGDTLSQTLMPQAEQLTQWLNSGEGQTTLSESIKTVGVVAEATAKSLGVLGKAYFYTQNMLADKFAIAPVVIAKAKALRRYQVERVEFDKKMAASVARNGGVRVDPMAVMAAGAASRKSRDLIVLEEIRDGVNGVRQSAGAD